MAQRALKLMTIPFDSWNRLHLCVAFCPIAIVGIAMTAAYFML